MNLYEQVQAEIKRESELNERERKVEIRERQIRERTKNIAANTEVVYDKMTDAEYYAAMYK